MEKYKRIGSDFEDWLEEEGIFEEVEVAAIKKSFVIQPPIEIRNPQGQMFFVEYLMDIMYNKYI